MHRAGTVLATAENTRRSLGSRAAVWAVRQGLIGEPVHGVVTTAIDAGLDIADPKWAWRNVKLLNGGGSLIDGGAHFADMMLQLFGPLESAACRTHQLREAPLAKVPVLGEVRVDAEDGWIAHLRFASGMEVSWTHATTVPGLELNSAAYFGRGRERWSTRAHGSCTPSSRAGWCARARGPSSARSSRAAMRDALSAGGRERLFPFGITDTFAIEVWDFIDAIRSGRAPEIDGAGGLSRPRRCAAEACYESAALGGAPVRHQDVLEGRVDAYQRPIDRQWNLLAAQAA